MPAAGGENEWLTRKRRIDPKLRASGWTIVPFDATADLSTYSAHAIEEYPTTNGPADYGLVVDGQLVGVVEAKKVTVGPAGVLIQAERYSKGVGDGPFNFRGFRVPFLYSTNGEVFWFHDVRDRLNLSRKVAAFHTPSALADLLAANLAATDWFPANPNDHPRLRPYQIEANTAVEQAITKRKRQMLVAMATGTGKTFTTVNQVYRLMKSGVGQRILFLVDRRALAAQAVRAFASFEPEPGLKFDKIYEVYSQRFQKEDFGDEEKFDPKVMPKSYLENPQPGHAFVYVCTIQRMTINLFGRGMLFDLGDEPADDDAEQLAIPNRASMGPRSVDRGKSSSGLSPGSTDRASMGPRSVDRGKSQMNVLPIRDAQQLQWGRDLLIAERMLTTTTPTRTRAASMGPRSVDRGKAAGSSWLRRSKAGFNGAAIC